MKLFFLKIISFFLLYDLNKSWSSSAAISRVVSLIIEEYNLGNIQVIQQDEDVDFHYEFWKSSFISTYAVDETEWRESLNNLNYSDRKTYVFHGSSQWIKGLMMEMKPIIEKNEVNIDETFFIWAINDEMEHRRNDSSNLKRTWKEFGVVISIGVTGALITNAHSNTGSEILISSRSESENSGSPFSLYATWTETKGLNLLKELRKGFGVRMTGRLIRITHLEKKKVFTTDWTKLLKNTDGYCADIMKIIQEKLDFESVLHLDAGFGNVKPEGGASGMVGTIFNNLADIAPLDFNPTLSRRTAVDFSLPVGTDVVLIMTKIPGPLPRPFILMRIFTAATWVFFGVSVFSGGVFLGVLTMHGSDERTILNHLSHGISQSYMIFLGQTILVSPARLSSRLLFAFLLLLALVIGATYKGSITAFLAIPVSSKPIDGVQDVLKSHLPVAVRDGTSFHNRMQLGGFNDVLPRMESFKGSTIKTKQFLDQVANYKFALFDSRSALLGYRSIVEKSDEKCLFHIGRADVIAMPDAFAIRKNSGLKKHVDRIVKWLRYCGIIEHFKSQYFQPPCKLHSPRNGPQPMTIEQIQSAFYILALGLSLGIISFIYEMLYSKFDITNRAQK